MTSLNDIIRQRGKLRAKLPDFAIIASEAIEALGLEREGGRGRPSAGEGVSERVVRDYVRRGVLHETEAIDGERGLYVLRHLLELLAARVLLKDGWPLEKIAERIQACDEDALIAMLPGAPPDPVALAQGLRVTAKQRLAAPVASMDVAAQAARLRAELPLYMRRQTGSSAPPKVRSLVSIEIGDTAAIQIDAEALRKMTLEDAKEFGRAVSAAIISQRNRGR